MKTTTIDKTLSTPRKSSPFSKPRSLFLVSRSLFPSNAPTIQKWKCVTGSSPSPSIISSNRLHPKLIRSRIYEIDSLLSIGSPTATLQKEKYLPSSPSQALIWRNAGYAPFQERKVNTHSHHFLLMDLEAALRIPSNAIMSTSSVLISGYILWTPHLFHIHHEISGFRTSEIPYTSYSPWRSFSVIFFKPSEHL